jgi:hypothetical protein
MNSATDDRQFAPNCTICVPAVVLEMNQVALDGRKNCHVELSVAVVITRSDDVSGRSEGNP